MNWIIIGFITFFGLMLVIAVPGYIAKKAQCHSLNGIIVETANGNVCFKKDLIIELK